ncbi:MAG: hypothetical protein GY820_30645 [Gammaproteobacteria bacterium]|nr:hypothetical protein [Gammaproteobacteria bacterium]
MAWWKRGSQHERTQDFISGGGTDPPRTPYSRGFGGRSAPEVEKIF